jgi:peptidyl-prolyl cis-trans isomerase B (cyclophilin B)
MKKFKRVAAVLLICVIGLSACGGKKGLKGNMANISELKPGDTYATIKIQGYEGEMTFILYGDIAPLGVKEFTKAARSGYYDGKNFHRVLEDMLIQGGALNTDGTDATIPEEDMFVVETNDNARNFFGALCFAVDENTGKNYRQFYIVNTSTPVDIDKEAEKLKTTIDKINTDEVDISVIKNLEKFKKELTETPAKVKERYLENGGLYLLDGKVTVFGQLISGREILEAVSKVEVVAGNRIDDDNESLGDGKGQNSRPLNEVFIETIKITTVPTEEATEEATKKSSKKSKKK